MGRIKKKIIPRNKNGGGKLQGEEKTKDKSVGAMTGIKRKNEADQSGKSGIWLEILAGTQR